MNSCLEGIITRPRQQTKPNKESKNAVNTLWNQAQDMESCSAGQIHVTPTGQPRTVNQLHT
jgi:hypothetical protein